MAETLTDGELVVLSLLAERPRHGYDIDRTIAERGVREWTSLGFSSIYYLLDRLAGRGLVEPEPEEADGRRTTYRLTGVGRRLQAEQALDALEALTPPHPRALVGIAGLPDLGAPEVADRLTRRLAAIDARLAHLRRRRDDQVDLPPQAVALFDYSAAALTAERDWTVRLLENGSHP
jgi:DNA-binding PadR family transcriptional regulator